VAKSAGPLTPWLAAGPQVPVAAEAAGANHAAVRYGISTL